MFKCASSKQSVINQIHCTLLIRWINLNNLFQLTFDLPSWPSHSGRLNCNPLPLVNVLATSVWDLSRASLVILFPADIIHQHHALSLNLAKLWVAKFINLFEAKFNFFQHAF